MKTTVQEIFDKLESEEFNLTQAWEWLMGNKIELLAKEKKALVDACEENNFGQRWNITGESYYNITYKDNENVKKTLELGQKRGPVNS